MDVGELLGQAVSRISCQCEGPRLAGVGRARGGCGCRRSGAPSSGRAMSPQAPERVLTLSPAMGLAAVGLAAMTHLCALRQASLGALGSAGHGLAGHRVRPSSASAPGGREG